MKLKKWALIAEIVGAVAIILSLLFVGIELNDSTRATRSATANQAISTVTGWYATIGNNAQASAVFWNAMADPDSQTPEEWLQFVLNLHGLLLSFQNSYYLAEEGTLDPEVHESITEVLVGVKDQPGFHRFWQQRRSIFFQGFQDYVDEVLASDRVNSEGLYKDTSRQ